MAKYRLLVEIDVPEDYDLCWQGPSGAVQCLLDTVVGPATREADRQASLNTDPLRADYLQRKQLVIDNLKVLSSTQDAVGGVPFIPGWQDAYDAFNGAFDTPIARRHNASPFAEDARRRMAAINEILARPTPLPNGQG